MKNLLIYNLKKKRNFVWINLGIIFVTAIISILLNGEYEATIYVSTFSALIISLVSAFIDFNIFLNENKLTYYLSKPMSMKKRVDDLLISNVIYMVVSTAISFLLAYAITIVAYNIDIPVSGELPYYLKFSQMGLMLEYCCFLGATVIFLIALSSMYTGSAISQVVATGLNFGLPGMLYLIFNAIISIDLNNIHVSRSYIIELYLDKLLPLNKIYFFEIFDGNDIFVIIRFAVTLAFIYGLTYLAIKHRKNERVGEFVVSYGYKNFVVLIGSTFVASVFAYSFRYENMVFSLIAFVIIFALVYYIAFIIVEKNFKIGMGKISLMFKYLIVSVVVIIASSFLMKYSFSLLPDVGEINKVYVCNTYNARTLIDSMKDEDKNIDDDDYEKIIDGEYFNYSDESTIKNLLMMNEYSNKYILNVDNYNYASPKFSLVYRLKDGSIVLKDVYASNMGKNSKLNNPQLIEKINAIICDIMRDDEFKEQKYENARSMFESGIELNIADGNPDVDIRISGSGSFEDITPTEFVDAYAKDSIYAISDADYVNAINYSYFSDLEELDVGRSTSYNDIYYKDEDYRADIEVPTYDDSIVQMMANYVCSVTVTYYNREIKTESGSRITDRRITINIFREDENLIKLLKIETIN